MESVPAARVTEPDVEDATIGAPLVPAAKVAAPLASSCSAPVLVTSA